VRAALGEIARLRESMLANKTLTELTTPAGPAAALCHPGLAEMVSATNEALAAWKVGWPC